MVSLIADTFEARSKIDKLCLMFVLCMLIEIYACIIFKLIYYFLSKINWLPVNIVKAQRYLVNVNILTQFLYFLFLLNWR